MPLMKKVIILGPAHPFRGGIASSSDRLAQAFQDEGYEVTIYNFSLQYPSFLFPGKTLYSSDPAPSRLKILSKINSINPINWLKIGRELKRLKPDLVIARFWIPFMGPAIGTILRIVRSNRHTRIISVIDNAKPHEKRVGDYQFTKYFLGACDGFVTMSE